MNYVAEQKNLINPRRASKMMWGKTHFHDAVTCHSRLMRAAAHPYGDNHIPPKYM